VPALLVAWNPLPVAAERSLELDLALAGLSQRATMTGPDGAVVTVALDGRQRSLVPVLVPARGFTWREFR
jgi:hypothetical protein